MNIIKSIIDSIVYKTTTKPEHYVRVKNPPQTALEKLSRPQDARQQQYNNWCKRKRVYNGSFLPKNPDTLTKKGWIESTPPQNTSGDNRYFTRKSSGQLVRHEKTKITNNKPKDEHYHWCNFNSPNEFNSMPEEIRYYDKYGNICKEKSRESHLAPYDKDYNYRK